MSTPNNENASAFAYVKQAAEELAGDRVFSSEDDFREWFDINIVQICERARDLQGELLEKLKNPDVHKAVSGVLSAKVHETVQVRRIREKTNEATARALR